MARFDGILVVTTHFKRKVVIPSNVIKSTYISLIAIQVTSKTKKSQGCKYSYLFCIESKSRIFIGQWSCYKCDIAR